MNTYVAPVMTGSFSGIITEASNNTSNQYAFEQESNRPAIDDVICHYLDGNTLKNALNFIDYIRASNMKIKWSAMNVWTVMYKSKHVLDIILRQDTWSVRLVLDHVVKSFGLSQYDVESIRSLVGALRVSMPEHLEPIHAMS